MSGPFRGPLALFKKSDWKQSDPSELKLIELSSPGFFFAGVRFI